MGAYNFHHRGKSSAMYITPLSTGKWDRMRDDCVIV
jgi:hypothetical protein